MPYFHKESCERKVTPNQITQGNLVRFLRTVDHHFPVPLSSKVNLLEYAQKLIERAEMFAEISETGEIEALVAGYICHVENNMAYIAIVATIPALRGQGIAGRLVRKFMARCCVEKRKGVHLYAVATNTSAVRLYEKLGFERYQLDGEQRPADLHLVHWFDREEGI